MTTGTILVLRTSNAMVPTHGGARMARNRPAAVALATAVVSLIATGCAPANNQASKAASQRPIPSSSSRATPIKSTIASTAHWSCGSPSPTASPYPTNANGSAVLAMSNVATVGDMEFQAAGLTASNCITFYASNDGGTEWRRAVVTTQDGVGVETMKLFMQSPSNGWLLVGGSPVAGPLPTAMYRTTDSGNSWNLLPAPPLGTPQGGMVFLSPANGWLTDFSTGPTPPVVIVSHTTNGGNSWTTKEFKVPPVAANAGSGTAFPIAFRSATDATFRVTASVYSTATNANQTITLVYGTSDGGTTWTLESQSAVTQSGVPRAHTPVSSPADVRPRPAPGVAPRSTYALNESQAWGLAAGAFGPAALWGTHQVTSIQEVQTTAGKAQALLDPLRGSSVPANSTVWVFEATGRFQHGSGPVANPPIFTAVWAWVVKGEPVILGGEGTTPVDLRSLGSVSDLPLSALSSGQ